MTRSATRKEALLTLTSRKHERCRARSRYDMLCDEEIKSQTRSTVQGYVEVLEAVVKQSKHIGPSVPFPSLTEAPPLPAGSASAFHSEDGHVMACSHLSRLLDCLTDTTISSSSFLHLSNGFCIAILNRCRGRSHGLEIVPSGRHFFSLTRFGY